MSVTEGLLKSAGYIRDNALGLIGENQTPVKNLKRLLEQRKRSRILKHSGQK